MNGCEKTRRICYQCLLLSRSGELPTDSLFKDAIPKAHKWQFNAIILEVGALAELELQYQGYIGKEKPNEQGKPKDANI